MLLSVLVLAPAPQEGPFAELIRERYSKSEHQIPMRDGVHLFTAIYRPKEASDTLPILLSRTPYGIPPYGEQHSNPWFLGPSDDDLHMLEGYVFVYQDVRGRMMSEGEFLHMRPLVSEQVDGSPKMESIDERTDAWDTIAWLLENVPGHNGRVGVWGGSYDGFYATCAAISGHPALVSALIQGPQTDWWFEDFHRNGILCLADAFDFLSSWGWPQENPTSTRPESYDPGSEDGYAFFLEGGSPARIGELHFRGEVEMWNQLLAHPDRDAFWKTRDLLPHIQRAAATLVVGGWFDHNNLHGTLSLYKTLAARSTAPRLQLVIGPWAHAAWQNRESRTLGRFDFKQPTSSHYREGIEAPFLRSTLRELSTGSSLPSVLVFDTGSLSWREFDHWPPTHIAGRELFLGGSGSLLESAPAPDASSKRRDSDELFSNPEDPVPAWIEPSLEVPETYLTLDQGFVEGRPDLLVYRTPVLKQPTTVAGPVSVSLWVSSQDAEDGALVVKVIDEAPANTGSAGTDASEARLLRWGAMSLRHRESLEEPRRMPAGEPVLLQFELLDVMHTFEPGHRIQVQIQPSLFPILSRIPHTWTANPMQVSEEGYRPATLSLHRSAEHASHLKLPVLSK